MIGSFTRERLEALRQYLLKDEEWIASCAYFSGKIGLADPVSAVVLIINGSNELHIEASSALEKLQFDFGVTGPAEDWKDVFDGRKDLFSGTNEHFGKLEIAGDPVAALTHVKVLWLIVDRLSHSIGNPSDVLPDSWSPTPVARGTLVAGRYANIGGVRIFYEEAGSGSELVCFHAAGQDTLMYRWVLDELSDSFRVIAVDLPGHGKSLVHPSGPFKNLDETADFAEKFVDHLGLNSPAILGCSMSGNLVLNMAARRPFSYSAIISAQGADYTPTLGEFVLDMLRLNGNEILECYARSLTGARTPPARAAEVVWQLVRCDPEIARTDLLAYAGFDARDQMAKVEAPVLLVRGTDDWLVSEGQVRDTAGRISNARVAMLDGTGHYPMVENPVEFNAAVRAFLTGPLRLSSAQRALTTTTQPERSGLL